MNNGQPFSITCQFIAKNWNEIPVESIAGEPKLSRISASNVLTGDIKGESSLEYLLSHSDALGDVVPFSGEELVVGYLGTRTGSFILSHEGKLSPQKGLSGQVAIKEGSGTGDFVGLAGSGSIIPKNGERGGAYALICVLPESGNGEVPAPVAQHMFTHPVSAAAMEQEVPKYDPEKHRTPLFSGGFVKGFGSMFIVGGVLGAILHTHNLSAAASMIGMGVAFWGAGKRIQEAAEAKRKIEYSDQ